MVLDSWRGPTPSQDLSFGSTYTREGQTLCILPAFDHSPNLEVADGNFTLNALPQAGQRRITLDFCNIGVKSIFEKSACIFDLKG